MRLVWGRCHRDGGVGEVEAAPVRRKPAVGSAAVEGNDTSRYGEVVDCFVPPLFFVEVPGECH